MFTILNKIYQYKYNGKEFQDELGLNVYDYGARNYDPALGRWMNIDPLAEKYSSITPYAYVANSPLVFVDPDGMRIEYKREEGQSRKEFRQARREFKEKNKQLMKDSQTHKNNFNQLKNSKNTHTISFNSAKGSEVGKVEKQMNRESGNNTNISINLEQMGAENEFVLAHEIGHAIDYDNGTANPNDLPNISISDDPNDVLQKTINVSNLNSEANERTASHIENVVRGEVSNSRGVTIPLRTTYDLLDRVISPISKKLTEKKRTINVLMPEYDYYKKKSK